MDKKNIYLTTTLPYVNSDPHIGFALEIVQADTIARFKRLQGHDVFFNFGTDEHGLKIYRKALEQGKDPQEYVNEYAAKFDSLKKALNLTYNNFIRTTDKHHIKAAQEFWEKCLENGNIYKDKYAVKYCVGCELEKTESELENDRCPIHPNLELEVINEENYFFRFSKYKDSLLKFYEQNPDFVVPSFRLNEINSFVEEGLQDFSVSRLKSKMPWGIEVPDDPKHVMFVWFDALVNYVSAVGWPDDSEKFKKWWPVIQFAGKDNLRQQSAIWQAMLMSAGLPNSKQIFIHGFITVDGQKISKSLGNVVNPIELVRKYGTDPVRYFLLSKIHPFEDSDFTIEKFEDAHNSDLANGLGNLVARVAKLCEEAEAKGIGKFDENFDLINADLASFRFDSALDKIWQQIKFLDRRINNEGPWKIKDKKQLKEKLYEYSYEILNISHLLRPFLPETAKKIEKQFSASKIKSEAPLFPRIK
ncbi:MAG: Methionyl-tRNA synthetase [Candidatus Woesebacteria bacterium GW2011_GWA2_44_33]|uniref:Methionine--tRNA ligase n=2 Tax=Candidatus Woeseibacteriota TaxID=1752722 RepID=A0A0G1R9I2_9BACT|nr:MAG: Methionyl-tRNA synthetase [Candidatus Woesebacteria bacterium GW2011_GWA2_44_33]KKU17575.1 MAG: Methionyl-tRNA synthetase [Candidatus Woesebacteria bacterium GW2011_GWC2_45_9]